MGVNKGSHIWKSRFNIGWKQVTISVNCYPAIKLVMAVYVATVGIVLYALCV